MRKRGEIKNYLFVVTEKYFYLFFVQPFGMCKWMDLWYPSKQKVQSGKKKNKEMTVTSRPMTSRPGYWSEAKTLMKIIVFSNSQHSAVSVLI